MAVLHDFPAMLVIARRLILKLLEKIVDMQLEHTLLSGLALFEETKRRYVFGLWHPFIYILFYEL